MRGRFVAMAAGAALVAGFLGASPLPVSEQAQASPADGLVSRIGDMIHIEYLTVESLGWDSETRRVCAKVKTPRGKRRGCVNVPYSSEVEQVRICVELNAKRYSGRKFCRSIKVPPESRPVPAPAPEDPFGPPTAVPYLPPDLNDPSLIGSIDDYALLNLPTDSNEPVRRDPCSVLTWRTDGDESQKQLIREALEQWTAATGLSVREIPPAKPEDGPSLADLEVRWRTPEESSSLVSPDGNARLGVATMSRTPGQHWFNYAIVVINEDLSPSMLNWSSRDDVWRHVLLHELGHTAGLDHPAASNQVMSATASVGLQRYQRGDLAGFAHIASFRECRTGSRW